MVLEAAFSITLIISIILGILCIRINKSKIAIKKSKSEMEASMANLERTKMALEIKLDFIESNDDHITALSNKIIAQNNDEFKKNATDPINTMVRDLNEKIEKMTTENATNKTSLSADMEKMAETAKHDITELSNKIIAQNNDEFKKNATDPINTMVRDLNEKIEKMTTENATNKTSFEANMQNMVESTKQLLKDTKIISEVMKNPLKHGRHAELGLERVFELSDLVKDVHYHVQESTESGKPDFIITLSEGRSFIVDSKAPLSALWNAYDTNDESIKSTELDKHVYNVKQHIKLLSKKEYWESKESSIEYVIMVMHEYALMPALDRYSELIEHALEKRVILVTPSTLMVLLNAVMLMWREKDLEQKIKSIGEEYSNIHKRLNKFAEYYNKTGGKLTDVISSYNSGIQSWNKFILPGANKITEAGLAKDMQDLNIIEKTPNRLPLSDVEA